MRRPTSMFCGTLLLIFVIEEKFQDVLLYKIFDAEKYNESKLMQFLKTLQQEKNYETIFIETCSTMNGLMITLAEDDAWLKELGMPVLIMTNNEHFHWKTHFNKELLVLKCLTAELLKEAKEKLYVALKLLASRLQHMRQTRVLIFIDIIEYQYKDFQLETQLLEFFSICYNLQLSNILVLLRDAWTSKNFYTYEKFPQMRLRKQSFRSTGKIFTSLVRNLQGYPLFTLPDQMKPRSIVYEDANGKQHLSGYIGKMLQTYAKKLNTSLEFPFRIQVGVNSFMGELENITRTGIIEIATALDTPKKRMNPYEFSFPVEYARWMPMLPVEPQLDLKEMFLLMFHSLLFKLIFVLSLTLSLVLTLCSAVTESGLRYWEILLNDKALRGILGQSFPLNMTTASRKELFISGLIFIAGLLVTTSYGAFLQSLLTEPPTQRRIDTFDDLLESNIKIMMAQQELPIIEIQKGKEFVTKYQKTFEVIPSFTDYLRRRNSFNNTYGYTVTTSIWPLLEQIQAGFQRKMFRLSPAMYFEAVVMFSLPVRENSIFMDTLNEFIMQVHAAGLMLHWRTATFIDMVANKIIDLQDLSQARRIQAIALHDLAVVWIVFGLVMSLSIGIFFMEIWVFKLIKKREESNKLRKHKEQLKGVQRFPFVL